MYCSPGMQPPRHGHPPFVPGLNPYTFNDFDGYAIIKSNGMVKSRPNMGCEGRIRPAGRYLSVLIDSAIGVCVIGPHQIESVNSLLSEMPIVPMSPGQEGYTVARPGAG
jgi:hypothetical protein